MKRLVLGLFLLIIPGAIPISLTYLIFRRHCPRSGQGRGRRIRPNYALLARLRWIRARNAMKIAMRPSSWIWV